MLNKIIEYKLISSIGHEPLTEEVNALIKDGWVPSGAPVSDGRSLYQAMVKFAAAE